MFISIENDILYYMLHIDPLPLRQLVEKISNTKCDLTNISPLISRFIKKSSTSFPFPQIRQWIKRNEHIILSHLYIKAAVVRTKWNFVFQAFSAAVRKGHLMMIGWNYWSTLGYVKPDKYMFYCYTNDLNLEMPVELATTLGRTIKCRIINPKKRKNWLLGNLWLVFVLRKLV